VHEHRFGGVEFRLGRRELGHLHALFDDLPFPRHPIDPAQVDRITEQLESLLKAVQPELTEASRGQIPRDLIPHLKQIEKLSKKLRRQLTP
jgi:hypothetical protein